MQKAPCQSACSPKHPSSHSKTPSDTHDDGEDGNDTLHDDDHVKKNHDVDHSENYMITIRMVIAMMAVVDIIMLTMTCCKTSKVPNLGSSTLVSSYVKPRSLSNCPRFYWLTQRNLVKDGEEQSPCEEGQCKVLSSTCSPAICAEEEN